MIVLSIGGAGIIGEVHGRNVIKAEWEAERLTIEREHIKQIAELNQKKDEVTNELQKKNSATLANYDDYIKQLLTENDGLSAEASTATRNSRACAERLSKARGAAFIGYIKDCQIIANRLTACQNIVK